MLFKLPAIVMGGVVDYCSSFYELRRVEEALSAKAYGKQQWLMGILWKAKSKESHARSGFFARAVYKSDNSVFWASKNGVLATQVPEPSFHFLVDGGSCPLALAVKWSWCLVYEQLLKRPTVSEQDKAEAAWAAIRANDVYFLRKLLSSEQHRDEWPLLCPADPEKEDGAKETGAAIDEEAEQDHVTASRNSQDVCSAILNSSHALHYAVMTNKSPQIVQWLLKWGCSTHECDDAGLRAMDYAQGKPYLRELLSLA